jgi:hypothetical protein
MFGQIAHLLLMFAIDSPIALSDDRVLPPGGGAMALEQGHSPGGAVVDPRRSKMPHRSTLFGGLYHDSTGASAVGGFDISRAFEFEQVNALSTRNPAVSAQLEIAYTSELQAILVVGGAIQLFPEIPFTLGLFFGPRIGEQVVLLARVEAKTLFWFDEWGWGPTLRLDAAVSSWALSYGMRFGFQF